MMSVFYSANFKQWQVAMLNSAINILPGAPFITWINFNPSIDK